jgi:hypothetical protein
MAGLSIILSSSWPPLAVRPCLSNWNNYKVIKGFRATEKKEETFSDLNKQIVQAM